MDFTSDEDARALLKSKGWEDADIDARLEAMKLGGGRGRTTTPVSEPGQKPPLPPDTSWEGYSKDAGSVVGGIAGQRVGGTKGALIGSGLGRAAVGAAQDVPELLSGDLAKRDFVLDAGREFARGSSEEYVGQLGYDGAKWLMSKAPKLSPEAAEFIDYIKAKLPELEAASWKDPLGVIKHPVNTVRKIFGVTQDTPVPLDKAITEGAWAKMYGIAGNVANTATFGGGKLAEINLRNEKILGQVGEDLATVYGNALPDEVFGQAIQATIDGHLQGVPLAAEAAKNTVAQLKPDLRVNIKELFTPLKKKARAAKALSKDPMNPIELGTPFEREMLDKLGQEPPYDALMVFRQELADKKDVKGIERLDNAVLKSLKKDKQASKAYQDYMAFDHMTEHEKGIFNNKFFDSLVQTVKGRAGYEGLADMLKPGKNTVSRARRLKTILDIDYKGYPGKPTNLPNSWRNVQATYMQRLLDGASVTTSKGARQLRGFQLKAKVDEPAMKNLLIEMYGKDHYKALKSFADNLTTHQGKSVVGGRGKLGVETREGGYIDKLTGGGLSMLGIGGSSYMVGAPAEAALGVALTGAGLAATPTLMGRWISDPLVVKWLSEGLRPPRKYGFTRVTSAVAGRFMRSQLEEAILGGVEQTEPAPMQGGGTE